MTETPKNDQGLMDSEDIHSLMNCIDAVKRILGDRDKTAQWFTTNNPHLGGAKPIEMFIMGRGHRVEQFIYSAEERGFDDRRTKDD